MAIVSYNGNFIVPAPLLSISESYVRSADGTPLSGSFELTLKGTLLPDIGSPRSNGAFSTTSTAANVRETSIVTDDQRFGSIIRKQQALRNLFTVSPGEPTTARLDATVKTEIFLDIMTDDGLTTILKCRPMMASISFSEDINVIKNEYTITLTTNELSLTGTGGAITTNTNFSDFKGYNLKSASDAVSVVFDNDYEGSYSVTRSISAQSAKVFFTEKAGSGVVGDVSGKSAMALAQDWVQKRFSATGISTLSAYSLMAPKSGYEFANHTTSEQGDDFAGSYSIQQNWKYIKSSFSGVMDDYNISMLGRAAGAYGMSSSNGFDKSFKVSGSIKGIATGAAAFTKAKAYFENVISASNFGILKTRIADSGGTFNPFINTTGASVYGPYSMTISENRRAGSINYDADFKEKPYTLALPFIDLDVTVTENRKENVIAEIPIPGRAIGPIIQDIKTTNTVKRTLSANFVVSTGVYGLYDKISAYRAGAVTTLQDLKVFPTGTQSTHYFISSFNESLDVSKGNYGMNVTFVFPGETGTVA
jgi:hypothetical protein